MVLYLVGVQLLMPKGITLDSQVESRQPFAQQSRADPSIAALTGRTEVRFADGTLVSQAISGAPCELEFAYGLTSGQSFTFTVHAVYLPRPRIEISGPQGVQASFDWQAARDAALGRMCTAVLVNDIEEY